MGGSAQKIQANLLAQGGGRQASFAFGVAYYLATHPLFEIQKIGATSASGVMALAYLHGRAAILNDHQHQDSGERERLARRNGAECMRFVLREMSLFQESFLKPHVAAIDAMTSFYPEAMRDMFRTQARNMLTGFDIMDAWFSLCPEIARNTYHDAAILLSQQNTGAPWLVNFYEHLAIKNPNLFATTDRDYVQAVVNATRFREGKDVWASTANDELPYELHRLGIDDQIRAVSAGGAIFSHAVEVGHDDKGRPVLAVEGAHSNFAPMPLMAAEEAIASEQKLIVIGNYPGELYDPRTPAKKPQEKIRAIFNHDMGRTIARMQASFPELEDIMHIVHPDSMPRSKQGMLADEMDYSMPPMDALFMHGQEAGKRLALQLGIGPNPHCPDLVSLLDDTKGMMKTAGRALLAEKQPAPNGNTLMPQNLREFEGIAF